MSIAIESQTKKGAWKLEAIVTDGGATWTLNQMRRANRGMQFRAVPWSPGGHQGAGMGFGGEE